MQTDERSLKWNQHPVISAVLWVLGTPDSHAAIGEDALRLRRTGSAPLLPRVSSSKERISWKDQAGGPIDEYFALHSHSHSHTATQSQERHRAVSEPLNTLIQRTHVPHNAPSQSISVPLSPAPSATSSNSESVTLAVSLDREAIDLHTHVNTRNNTHTNIYSASSTSSSSTSSDSEAFTLPARRFDALDSGAAPSAVEQSSSSSVSGNENSQTSTSPNWGFFVNMTPTEQESYARSSGSACPPYARRP